ncbi:hypothetical protein QQ045_025478 [Rhodiola kirilowii]
MGPTPVGCGHAQVSFCHWSILFLFCLPNLAEPECWHQRHLVGNRYHGINQMRHNNEDMNSSPSEVPMHPEARVRRDHHSYAAVERLGRIWGRSRRHSYAALNAWGDRMLGEHFWTRTSSEKCWTRTPERTFSASEALRVSVACRSKSIKLNLENIVAQLLDDF